VTRSCPAQVWRRPSTTHRTQPILGPGSPRRNRVDGWHPPLRPRHDVACFARSRGLSLEGRTDVAEAPICLDRFDSEGRPASRPTHRPAFQQGSLSRHGARVVCAATPAALSIRIGGPSWRVSHPGKWGNWLARAALSGERRRPSSWSPVRSRNWPPSFRLQRTSRSQRDVVIAIGRRIRRRGVGRAGRSESHCPSPPGSRNGAEGWPSKRL